MDHQDLSPPLYEVISLKSYLKCFFEVFLLFLLFSLLAYRALLSYDGNNSPLLHLMVFISEAWFTLIWAMVVSTKWSPVHFKTYPERLLQKFQDLPPVDIFVTTTDPKLEPPMILMNTVISLLAADYEPHKLACYVSDDAGSPITLFSLIQASQFAKKWIPFCKKYKVQVRAPFRYFGVSSEPLHCAESPEFQQEWQDMKSEYDQLIFRVEDALKSENMLMDSKEFEIFANSKRDSHQSIVKVILANEGDSNELPNLIYVAREKNPEHSHHYKAGAMNVLARVSGVMTNAPFILNLDCDMFNNNPQTIQHALCLLMGSKTERECAFVQFPQVFYNGLKDDPFGNQLVVAHKKFLKGICGIQGSLYIGTGCFLRRKIIYGLPLDEAPNRIISDHVYGKSHELINSVDKLGSESARHCILDSLHAAHEVARCSYEHGTKWGVSIGWMYGSIAEDTLTGLTIHSKGYKSMYCDPEPPSFMGCVPPSGPLTITQVKRWTTGLLEIFFSKKNPIILSFTSKIQLRQSIVYTWILIYGLRSVPEIYYSFLPAYCIISNSAFLPNVDQPAWLVVVLMIFLIYNAYTLTEYLECGLSLRAWWNNQRVQRIKAATAFFFGFIGMLLKLLGLSETVFEVTSKGTSQPAADNDDKAGRFTFDESPIFVPATTLVLFNMGAVGLGCIKVVWALTTGPGRSGIGFGAGELGCCVWLLMMLSPFVMGLFGKGKYGIPFKTIYKSMGFALALFSLSYRA